MKTVPFNSRSRTFENRRTPSTGGSGRRFTSLNDMWRPEKDGKGTPCILVAGKHTTPIGMNGEYIEKEEDRLISVYNMRFQHRAKLGGNDFKTIPCTAGFDPHNPKPCVPCYMMQQGEDWVSRSPVYDFTVVLLKDFHIIEERVKSKKQPGKEYTNQKYEPCEGRKCALCADGVEAVFGRRVYMSLGKNHRSNLETYAEGIQFQCANCGGSLYEVAYKCPLCETVHIDASKKKRAELEELVADPFVCTTCGEEDYLAPVFECEKCEEPKSTPMFNETVLWLFRSGEKTDSILSCARAMPLKDFLGDDTAKWDRVHELMDPIDFSKAIWSPDLDHQAEMLNVQNPYEAKASKDYNR